jgi:hypothetical protein
MATIAVWKFSGNKKFAASNYNMPKNGFRKKGLYYSIQLPHK